MSLAALVMEPYTQRLCNWTFGGDYDERAVEFSIKMGLKKNRRYIQFDLETWKVT